MYEFDEDLFGRDMRHKPPFPNMLTARGWGSSHGRLAYTSLNRQQDSNVSEYAVSQMGFMPKGYVIIDKRTMSYDKRNAIKVSQYRVAIPVREFAKRNRLTIQDQWELINYKFVGSFDPAIDVKRRRDYPRIEDAYMKAEDEGRLKEFVAQFWDIKKETDEYIDSQNQKIEELRELEYYASCELLQFFRNNFDYKKTTLDDVITGLNRRYDDFPLSVIERKLMIKHQSLESISRKIRLLRQQIKEYVAQRSIQL